ncbi:MAG: LLM class flavin-dependent oxidoreductase [Actinomycetia bacterium]|nr:LLM class flavin-dependent oxidoreductase [Actinomycetes bacterium]MCP4086251.1 LLM class flavin-dependent oxidoreductase [Actinomycetes bacterium]
MRIGIISPTVETDGSPLQSGSIADGARRIETAGFDSLWVFDAVARGFMLADPLIAVAVAATATERLEVGTCILQVPLRHPVELAHRILTTQLVCGGRFSLGVGAGSTKTDFDAIGLDYNERLTEFETALPIMRTLWDGEDVDGARLDPWPDVLGGPPVLIGSWGGRRWIDRAATQFDGWIASAAKTNPSTLATGIERYRAAGGQRSLVTNIVVDLSAETSPLADDGPFDLRCQPDEAARRLARLAELGFDDAILFPSDTSEGNLAAVAALRPG